MSSNTSRPRQPFNTSSSRQAFNTSSSRQTVPWPPPSGWEFDPKEFKRLQPRKTFDIIGASDTGILPGVETVTVIVGDDELTAAYELPKQKLCELSVFFDTACNGRWSEYKDNTIRIKDMDVAVFDMFARWVLDGAEIMYNAVDWKAAFMRWHVWTRWLRWVHDARLDRSKLWPNMRWRIAYTCIAPRKVWNFELTTEGYVLGDYLMCADFKNHCMAHLYYMHYRFDNAHSSPGTEWDWSDSTIAFTRGSDVLLAWDSTPEDDPIRLFFKHFLSRYWDAYPVSIDDVQARKEWEEVMERIPELRNRVLFELCRKEKKNHLLLPLKDYYSEPFQRTDHVLRHTPLRAPNTSDHRFRIRSVQFHDKPTYKGPWGYGQTPD